MEKKFHALRFIGTFYKIVGILLAVATILSALGVFVTAVFGGAVVDEISRELDAQTSAGLFSGFFGGAIVAVGIFLSGGITALTTYAIGEAFYLLIALEENTRATASWLGHQLNRQTAAPKYEPQLAPVEEPQAIPAGGV